MKQFDRIFIIVITVIVIFFAGLNIILVNNNKDLYNGRPYRVEIKRAAAIIKEKGIGSVDLESCKYITNIEKYNKSSNFYNTSSDYYICSINGALYRFDYVPAINNGNNIIIVNIFLAIMIVIVITIFVFLRQKILLPFERLKDVPYELSRGNLIIPVHENKNRYFGKFLWGIDLLRENIEQQKQRELKLQKDKNTLLLSISHDIKTPLSAIKLYSKAFLTNLYPDREKQYEIMEKINNKADEIEGFVSQLAKASSEEYLSLDVNAGEFFLSDIINNISGYYNEKLRLVNTKFDIGKYSDCLVSGDIDRGTEVLQNIIENAIKYGDGYNISIDIQEEEDSILIAVKNSGCTLPETEYPHIFDSFWRGSNAGNNKGSGLGLYICRQLMYKMNGGIFAEIVNGFMIITVIFPKV